MNGARDSDPEDPAGAAEHQPPSPRDLERHPPADAACAHMRGLLRDYADGELEAALRERVDEHAHFCRGCGVALSRAEAETLRLRQGLAGPPVEPSASFTRAVLARLAEERRAAGGTVSADFTPRVMDRVRREWDPPRLSRRMRGLLRRQFAVLTTALALLLLTLGYLAASPDTGAEVHVVGAQDATLARGGRTVPAREGQRLQPGDLLRTGPADSRVLVRVPCHDDPAADAASLAVEADAALSLETAPAGAGAAFRLESGAVVVRVREGLLRVLVGAEGVLSLAPGQYRVYAETAVRHDSRVAADPFKAVRLEVESGSARIARGRLPGVPVAAGTAALFDEWSPVTTEPLLTEDELVALAEQHRKLPAPRSLAGPGAARDWLGTVLNGQTKAPVPGATVRISSRLGEITVATAFNGGFRLPGLAELEGETALVQVTLPVGAPAAAFAGVTNFFGPVTFRARGRGAERELLLDPLHLPPERLVMGMVLDPNGRPLVGARVTALLVDQVIGGALSLAPGVVPAAVTNEAGRFELRGLGVMQSPHTAVYLTIEHAHYGTVAATDLLAEPSLRDLSLQVAMLPRQRVSLAGLPARASVELLESIRDLPAETMLVVRRAATDDRGEASLEIAHGARLWLRSDGRIHALVAQRGGGSLALAGAPALGPLSRWGRRRAAGTGPVALQSFARTTLAPASVTTARRELRVMAGDRQDPIDARLYLVHADGSGYYLGALHDGVGTLDLPADGDYRIFAISDSGEVGVLDATAADGDVLNVRVVAPGAAQIPPDALGGAVAGGGSLLVIVELTRIDGQLAGTVVHRHASHDTGWALQGLVPGRYSVRLPDGRTGQVVVPSGGSGTVVLN